MTQFQKISLFLLRLSLGWLFFYAGITKVLNPAWSAAGYLKGAKTFPEFYHWLITPDILPITNFLNEWGLTLIGVAIILGICVRMAGILGALLMILYYFPILVFPKIGTTAYLIDEHIIFAIGFLLLVAFKAGKIWGLEQWCSALPICKRFPKLRHLLG